MYKDKIDKFILNNSELIEKYNKINTDNFVNYSTYIIDKYQYLCTQIEKPISFNTFLRKILNNGIKYSQSIIDSIFQILYKYINKDNNEFNNLLQIYFYEINNIYEKNENNYDIPFCIENRNKIIEMNLKNVISIAKKYQGLGLTLEELISAGNLGLVHAFDKFDTSRTVLRDNILNAFMQIQNWPLSYQEIYNILIKYINYGSILEKFNKVFNPNEKYLKNTVINWIKKNIFNAKFNSVAVMWIKAYILQELDNNSRLIKKSKTETTNNNIISLDLELDNNHTLETILAIEDPANLDNKYIYEDNLSQIQDILLLLFKDIRPRNKIIVLHRFGIGLPRPMTTQEISDAEGLSCARISQIINNTLKDMKKNAQKYNIDPKYILNLSKNL